MANAAVATWTKCIKEIQNMIDAPSTAPATKLKQKTLQMKLGLLEYDGSLLPNAAWKKLVQDVQVMRTLAELCIRAHQQHIPLTVKAAAAAILASWLSRARQQVFASPQSLLAASVRQQLQESGLLQHMGAMFTDAGDGLKTAVAAAAVGGSARSSSGSSTTASQQAADQVELALVLVNKLVCSHHAACAVFCPGASGFSLEAALPAAPAVMRLILTTYRTCSRLQQLTGREDSPAPLLLLAGDPSFQYDCRHTLRMLYWPLGDIAGQLHTHNDEGSLQSLPGVHELLLCPELVPCIAITVLVGLLGFSTGGQAGAGSSGQNRGTAGSASSSSSSSSTSTRRLPNGISLDSLTPLSRGLFGLLGVEQGVLLEVARKASGGWTGGSQGIQFRPENLACILSACCIVLDYQVQHWSTPCGASTTELLKHTETHMLLSLVVHQLAASIPAVGYPAAKDIRFCAPRYGCTALRELWHKTSLHQLPLPAPYTGPQLALQVVPSPLGPPPLTPLLQGQQSQQLPQQQQLQYYTVTPAAQLLTELLPLLTSSCLARIQHQQQRRQELLSALEGLLQQAEAGELAAVESPSLQNLTGIVIALEVVTDSQDCTPRVVEYMQHALSLLSMAIAPDPTLTAAEVQAAADSTVQSGGGVVAYRCVLQAPDAVVQVAGDVVHLCEVLLRGTADKCETVVKLHSDKRVVAALDAAASAAEGGGEDVQQLAASRTASAEKVLATLAEYVAAGTSHSVRGDLPYTPSALALAALAAGPGSSLQRRLFSLLCSMVKVGSTPVSSMVPQATAGKAAAARSGLVTAAVSTVAALIEGAADKHQSCPAGGGGGHTAAASMLPGLFIMGRCFMWWARVLQQGSPSAGVEVMLERIDADAGLAVSAVQQWLQASSIQGQLLAAGYAPQALPQQLQQAVAALQAVRNDAGSSQPDTARVQEAVQQLQAAGSALCSFAVHCLCNSPSCANLSGLTELGLVSGRSCVCGGCRVARYCGRACQRAAWKQHKPLCAALAAAVAAAAAAGAADAAVPSRADA